MIEVVLWTLLALCVIYFAGLVFLGLVGAAVDAWERRHPRISRDAEMFLLGREDRDGR